MAEYQGPPDIYKVHPSTHTLALSKWVHMTLRAFGGTNTSSLTVDGVGVETNAQLLNVPTNGVGSLGAIWVGEIHSGVSDSKPLDFFIDNVRLTSP